MNPTRFLTQLSLALLLSGALSAQAPAGRLRTLVVVFDGLRPDYIRPETMPRLYAFREAGSHASEHHSVFPTVTRVNTSSYSTGSYPKTHGLMGNTVFFPTVNPVKGLNTGNFKELLKANEASGGQLLTTPSLGELLQAAGERMMVFSSGSTGQALLQNRKVSGGAVINPGMILPEEWKEKVIREIGPLPAHGKPNLAQHRWITDALLRYGLVPDGPLVSSIWFSDPDGTAHAEGVGTPVTMQAIKLVDEQFGRILDSLQSRNLLPNYNILVTADHGFVTNVGKTGLSEFLVEQGLKAGHESDDVVVAEGALYVKNHDPVHIQRLVTALQAQPWVGAIFTKAAQPGDLKGSVPGTLSFESIHWNHAERSADILVDEAWNDDKNSAGYAGTSFSRGIAGHGSISPYEVHIALIASGPGFKKSHRSNLPTSIIDMIPTVLHLHRLPVPATMDGRILTELLISGKPSPEEAQPQPKTETVETTAAYPGGTYTLMLEQTTLGRYRYVNSARVNRTAK